MPQPVDLQSELMRVTQAERVQQLANRNAQVMQHRAATVQQQQEAQADSQVVETAQAEEGKVDPDGKGDEKKRRKRRKNKVEDTSIRTFYTAQEKPEVVEDPGEHHLDISI